MITKQRWNRCRDYIHIDDQLIHIKSLHVYLNIKIFKKYLMQDVESQLQLKLVINLFKNFSLQ